jgi:hypothetical protein
LADFPVNLALFAAPAADNIFSVIFPINFRRRVPAIAAGDVGVLEYWWFHAGILTKLLHHSGFLRQVEISSRISTSRSGSSQSI